MANHGRNPTNPSIGAGRRAVVAMSGGVDSSVAAHLLAQQGWDVVGVFMRHGHSAPSECTLPGSLPVISSGPEHKQGCCSASDALDARRVADQLGIPFYALNLEEDFGRIIEYFVDEYVSGRTPNPCVVCNHWIKFGRLFSFADSMGADYVATGHYARLEADPQSGSVTLRRGVDCRKDQSYVLFGVARPALNRMLLPVGWYSKSEIRAIASQLGMRVAEKRDSQEICFVAAGRHGDFVARRKGERVTAGELVTTDGRVVGRHDGVERFTVGQRKGLGVALGEPYYVIGIEPLRQRVIVGPRSELARTELVARHANWLTRPTPQFHALAQIRYNSPAVPATVSWDGQTVRVRFDQPCYAVAPGQAVVLYDQDRVLGGAWIESAS